jgi:hypothetical protein
VPIHPSARKVNSPKFAGTEFSEVWGCLQLVCLWATLELISTKDGNGLLVQRCDPPKESSGSVALVGVCALIRRIRVSSVLVSTLWVILVAANHR